MFKRIIPSYCLRIAAILALTLVAPAWAGAATWTCTGTNWWDNTSCWNTGLVPAAAEVADVLNTGSSDISVDYRNGSDPVLTYLMVDSTGTGAATLNMSQDSLSAVRQYVGYNGTGTFNQGGGTNTITTNFLTLGYSTGSSGAYNLSGTGSISAANETIGLNGYGEFTQTAGTNSIGGALRIGHYETGVYNQGGGTTTVTGDLTLGHYGTTSNGTYVLSGTGSLSAANEHIGYDGTGTFNQSGGTNTVSGELSLGKLHSYSSGTYTLSGGTLSAQNEFIGHTGTGVVNQSGGTHMVDAPLSAIILGYNTGSIGTYNQSGGSLSAWSVHLGQSGAGEFNQSGGTGNIDYLYLGYLAFSSGAYDLSGTGSLTAGTEHIGYNSTGVFTQTGGTHDVSTSLYIGRYAGSNGTYNQSGGSLNVNNNIYLGHDLNSIGRYNLGGTGSISATSMHVGLSGQGEFTQSGGTNNISSYLYLGNGTGSDGVYRLQGGSLNVLGIYSPGGAGVLEIDGGTLTVGGGTSGWIEVDDLIIASLPNDGTSSHTLGSGQTISTTRQYIGLLGTAELNQTGGMNDAGTQLYLGRLAGSRGTYNLSGGDLSATNMEVGGLGTGTFNHTGGNSTVGASFVVGSNGPGTYNLGGTGALSTQSQTIGLNGAGQFIQTDGTNTISGSLAALTLGQSAGSSGTYTLSGGDLQVSRWLYVGKNGTGEFNQSGGASTVGSEVIIAENPGSAGTYSLSGGTLTAGNITNNGTFNYSGGAINMPSYGMFTNNGNLNLSGAGTRTINGSVTNYGTVKVVGTTVVYTGTYTELGVYSTDPSTSYFTDLVIGDTGYMVGGAGDYFYVSGNLTNNSTQGALWDTIGAYLGFTGPGAHELHMADWSVAGDFAWGTMELLDAGSLTLMGALTGDLYVGDLILGAGTSLNLNGFNIYYTSLVDLGVTYSGGELYSMASVPEPSTLLLLGSGLAGLGLARRGRKA